MKMDFAYTKSSLFLDPGLERCSLPSLYKASGSVRIKWEPNLETCGGNLFPLLGGWECFKHGDYNRNQQ